MPEWIKCDEKLPERGRMVLVAVYGSDLIKCLPGETWEQAAARIRRTVRRVEAAWIDEEGNWCDDNGWLLAIQPIWWMPMPDAPEYEEGQDAVP